MPTIVDSSVALGWLLGEPGASNEIIRDAQLGMTLVPAHWGLEVANGLAMAARRRRIPHSQCSVLLDLLAQLDVEIGPPPEPGELKRLDALAAKHKLTVYDAAYLDFAIRRGAALATFDAGLRAAAKKEKVALLPA